MSKESVAPAPKSLVTKLAEACNTVGGVAKKGRNEHQRYDYVKAADVAKAIRRELFKRNILLLADEKEVTQVDIQTISGNAMRQVTLKVEYRLHDGDSGQILTMTAFGVAMDSGDKAIWKAKTGAQKYFLRGLGLIPDEKDDPEADTKVDEFTDPKGYQAKSDKRQDKATTQIMAFNVACKKSDKTDAQKTIYLRKRWNRDSAGDLAKEEFTAAMQWATGSLEEEMAQTVEFINGNKKKAAQPVVAAAEAQREDEVAGD